MKTATDIQAGHIVHIAHQPGEWTVVDVQESPDTRVKIIRSWTTKEGLVETIMTWVDGKCLE